MKKQYTGTTEDFEKKLGRVMDRLGVDQYQSSWNQGKGVASCYVEMMYGGKAYRFENSSQKSAACGRNLYYVSDLFAEVVYSLEGLARAVEKGIFTLDMLLAGVPALPSAPPMEPCFAAMGFSSMPSGEAEVKAQYRRLAKILHPDKPGGDKDAFQALNQNYEACLEIVRGKT